MLIHRTEKLPVIDSYLCKQRPGAGWLPGPSYLCFCLQAFSGGIPSPALSSPVACLSAWSRWILSNSDCILVLSSNFPLLAVFFNFCSFLPGGSRPPPGVFSQRPGGFCFCLFLGSQASSEWLQFSASSE